MGGSRARPPQMARIGRRFPGKIRYPLGNRKTTEHTRQPSTQQQAWPARRKGNHSLMMVGPEQFWFPFGKGGWGCAPRRGGDTRYTDTGDSKADRRRESCIPHFLHQHNHPTASNQKPQQAADSVLLLYVLQHERREGSSS